MDVPDRYTVIAIPLRRPDVVDFLTDRSEVPRGAALQILAQRPTPQAEAAWAARLKSEPTLEDLLSIDDPHGYLVPTHTDRLVPVQFLEEEGFLTRNLGGWSPVYFAVAGLPASLPEDDPLMQQAEVLTDFGDHIQSFGADPSMVRNRLPDEMEGDLDHAAASVRRLHRLGREFEDDSDGQIRALFHAFAGEAPIETDAGRPVPSLLLADSLMGRMVRVEARRRRAVARGDADLQARIEEAQATWSEELGLTLILKGEYIAGRHRRSTILIAGPLGIVVKQPGLEPFHDIELGARAFDGKEENWPFLTRDGAVVTSRGRLRLVLQENVVPRLHRAFDHEVHFSSALGTIVEEYVDGPTVQEYVQNDPDRLTRDLYERVLATQQVCEFLGVNNPDWHAANFIVRSDDERLIHIDWGAARPLESHEKSAADRRVRLNQVENLAFSFQSDALANRTIELHESTVTDPDAMRRVRNRARDVVRKQA